MNSNLPDMNTIKRYWGSLEAYQEEQRRSALLNLEALSQEDTKRGWNWDFSFRPRRSKNGKRSGR